MARPIRTAPPVTSTERPRQLSRGSSTAPERSMLTAAVAPSTLRFRDGEEEQAAAVDLPLDPDSAPELVPYCAPELVPYCAPELVPYCAPDPCCAPDLDQRRRPSADLVGAPPAARSLRRGSGRVL